MATFHINRSGTSLGTFSEDEVREGLRSGKFGGTDLGWREGMATWQPLAQISEFAQETGPGAAPSPQPQFTGGGAIAWQSRKPDNAHDGWRDPATVLYYFSALGRGHQRVYQFRNFASLPHDCWGSKATL